MTLTNGTLPQRGHIYTSFGAFIIEPVEAFNAENQNILHKITQMITHINPKISTTPAEPNTNSSCALGEPVEATTQSPHQAQSARRKRAVNLPPPQPTNAYTMKVLIGVDAKMKSYHHENGYNLKEYILTLMSIVSILSECAIAGCI